jgi:hypothetical protein
MMKAFLTIAAVATFALGAQAVEYSVFRVCEDQHVIRTSDGAEAGRVEYIVVEPSSHRVISTVITGGVVGTRLVALPISSLQFGAAREITLTQIDRARLVSAPVIEKTQISTTVVQPALIERSYTHFGARLEGGVSTRSESRTRTDTDDPSRTAEQPGRTTTGGTTTTDPSRKGRTGRQPSDQPEAVGERTRDRQQPATPGARGSATPGPRESTTPGAREGKMPSSATPSPGASRERSQTPPSEKSATDKPSSERPGSETEGKTERSGRSGEASQRSGQKSEQSGRSASDSAEPRTDKSGSRSDQPGRSTDEPRQEKKQQ